MQYVGYGIFGAVLIFFLVFFCGVSDIKLIHVLIKIIQVLSPYYVYLGIKRREERMQLKRMEKLLTRKDGRTVNEV